MKPGTLLTRTKQWLKKHDIRISKRLGQHFLVDEGVLNRIIEHAHLSLNDQILEIGTGNGVLTKALVKHVQRVYTIEKDTTLFQILSEELGAETRIQLVHGDATKIDWPLCDKLVANLPYAISSPVLFKFFDSKILTALVMLQKEFGQRLTAQPGSKEYGRLTVMAAYHATVNLVEIIKPDSFYPPPGISSALVRITRKAQPTFEVKDFNLFKQVVTILFNQRRKKIRSPLKAFLGNHEFNRIQTQIPNLNQRVEELNPRQIANISNIINEARAS
jgi:16S rRNA (adenine1518-N6/adenine1519-N6)-dimethyltransferase